MNKKSKLLPFICALICTICLIGVFSLSAAPSRGVLGKNKNSPQPPLIIGASADVNLLTLKPHMEIDYKWTGTATYNFVETFRDGEVVTQGPITRDAGGNYTIGVDFSDGTNADFTVEAIPQ